MQANGDQVEEVASSLQALPRLADPQPVPCKICGGASPLFGVVDAKKSCLEEKGIRLGLSGCPVYYRRCERCGFTFTQDFDAWDHDAFHRNIYNQDYIAVDPDFAEVRPAGNAALIAEAFAASKGTIRLLDYGGGSGLLAARLRERGFDATTYDPFSEHSTMPKGKFDLISCFEVMEHVPFPGETVATIVGMLAEGGALLFSTLVQPANFQAIGLAWWYAAPRNGHVSLYTTAALAHLFKPHGLRVGSFNDALHIAYGTVPRFAQHLNLPA